jgi:hypothetical protein
MVGSVADRRAPYSFPADRPIKMAPQIDNIVVTNGTFRDPLGYDGGDDETQSSLTDWLLSLPVILLLLSEALLSSSLIVSASGLFSEADLDMILCQCYSSLVRISSINSWFRILFPSSFHLCSCLSPIQPTNDSIFVVAGCTGVNCDFVIEPTTLDEWRNKESWILLRSLYNWRRCLFPIHGVRKRYFSLRVFSVDPSGHHVNQNDREGVGRPMVNRARSLCC